VNSFRLIYVTRPDHAERALGGRIDILVNAAGIYPRDPILEMTEESREPVLDVNLNSTFLLSRECCRCLIGVGARGAIVNVTSGAVTAWAPRIAAPPRPVPRCRPAP
jgi:NAD(P)-dependent dehydrogenase (short-subunit alcohol dehydrogenase family)